MAASMGKVLLRSVSASQMDMLSVMDGWKKAGIIENCPIGVREADCDKLLDRKFRDALDKGNFKIMPLEDFTSWERKHGYGLFRPNPSCPPEDPAVPCPPEDPAAPCPPEDPAASCPPEDAAAPCRPEDAPCPELAEIYREVFGTPSGKLFGHMFVDGSTPLVNGGSAGEQVGALVRCWL
jgi:hypothetical protein